MESSGPSGKKARTGGPLEQATLCITPGHQRFEWLTDEPDAGEMDLRVQEAERVSQILRDFELRLEAFILKEGEIPKMAPDAIPEQYDSALGPLPRVHPTSAEDIALHHALKHTVPVPDSWDYFTLITHREWQAAMASAAKKLVSYRYLGEPLYYLKGCHEIEGKGSLEAVLCRVTEPDQHIVLKLCIRKVRELGIPVMAERLDRPGAELWHDTLHPHVFGPLPMQAVVAWAPLKRTPGKVGVSGVAFPLTVDQDNWKHLDWPEHAT